jgi:cell division protein ZapA (FtsZ GTPase activity inhibitor)
MMESMSAPRRGAVRSVRVSVAGHSLALRTDARAAYVRALADYVGVKIAAAQNQHQERGRPVSAHGLALLAALQMADELMQLRADKRELEADVRARSQRILDYLDQLAPSAPSAPSKSPPRRRAGTTS